MRRVMPIARIAVAALPGLVALFGCHHEEHIGTVAGPGLTVEPAALDAAPGAAPGASPSANAPSSGSTAPTPSAAPVLPVPDVPTSPIVARFEEIGGKSGKKKTSVTFVACEQFFVAVAKGKAKAAGESLETNDLLLAQGAGTFDVTGDALVVIASMRPRMCEPPKTATAITKHVIHASTARELTWAKGAMHAHLDAEGDASPLAYFGRLGGTAPVQEHDHASSWEVLLAVEAAGTFTLDGNEQRLGPRQIVVVPPGTKHAWRPDEGKPLVAFQMYAPPGPEQRFKKLAEAEAVPGR